MNKFGFESIGSHFEISIYDDITTLEFNRIQNNIINNVKVFNDKYSRFVDSSVVSFLENKTGVFVVPKEFVEIMEWYFKFYKSSNHKFTPLIGSMLSDIGYDKNYSLTPKDKIRNIDGLYESIKIIDEDKIEVLKPVSIDFGGVGKGYIVDYIKNYLRENNIKKFIVNGGGDIYYETNDDEYIKCGLENPNNFEQIIGDIKIKNSAFCASSGSRRKWDQYHHIIDPDLKKQNEDIIATWVIAESTQIADTIATCLFMCAPENFEKDFKFEYLILNKDMKIKKSENFNCELY